MTITARQVGIEAYQAAAKAHGTKIESASPGFSPIVGGAITKHPLNRAVADSLACELTKLGAEVRLTDDNSDGSRAFVYLSGCSFRKGEKL